MIVEFGKVLDIVLESSKFLIYATVVAVSLAHFVICYLNECIILFFKFRLTFLVL